MKKVLIVGAGAQGGPGAAILAGEKSVTEIRFGDIISSSLRKSPKSFFEGKAQRGVPFRIEERIIKQSTVDT